MVLPQAVLRAATHGPALVELKNGDSYSGTLAAVDNLMNIRLENTVFTPLGSQRFERLKECTIRGQFVKFVRFPDNVLDSLAAQQEAAQAVAAAGARWKGRGGRSGGGRSGGRGHSVDDSLVGATQSIAVPAALVGAIIGRGGETIKRFSDESGARIAVDKDVVDASDERNIYLSGSLQCIEHARELISALVRERSGPRGHSGRSGNRRVPSQRFSGQGSGSSSTRGRGGKGKGNL